MARATAHRFGHRAVFSPKPVADDVGNGVHIHLSLHDRSGNPVTFAADQPMRLSRLAQQFCAGVLEHLPAICAVTAPSPVSYLRLTPERLAPTAIDIAAQDRGAALRVCPVFAASGPVETARHFNVEFRVADGAASPYMALGAVVFAGAEGISRALSWQKPAGGPEPLPRILPEALDRLADSEAARRWFGPVFLDAYLRYKRAEAEHMAGLEPAELCARYAEVY